MCFFSYLAPPPRKTVKILPPLWKKLKWRPGLKCISIYICSDCDYTQFDYYCVRFPWSVSTLMFCPLSECNIGSCPVLVVYYQMSEFLLTQKDSSSVIFIFPTGSRIASCVGASFTGERMLSCIRSTLLMNAFPHGRMPHLFHLEHNIFMTDLSFMARCRCIALLWVKIKPRSL